MDREIIEPTIEEKIKARKAVLPILGDLFKNIKIEDNRQNIIQVPIDGIKKALSEAISKIKLEIPESLKVKGQVEVINQKDIQQVEVINQKEINIENKVIEFPELQKVIGEVRATNLPIGIDKETSREANPTQYLIVRLSDGQRFIDNLGGGATSAPMGRSTENIYLREEYDYISVSGIRVVNRVRKWTDTMLLTETYEYDGNADPIKKFRSIEPL